MNSPQPERLSDLEGAALALIAQSGEATSYQVAAQFAGSPAEYWSGSAGAVYPMMTRLERRGLIVGAEGMTGKRARTVWRLTDQGRAAMIAWLTDAERASEMGFDPLRTRLAHLDLMTAAQRRTFLDGVARFTEARRDPPSFAEKPWMQKVQSSWVAARLHWLSSIRAAIK
jgi:DNA-binding PadR family transcriptional regulator